VNVTLNGERRSLGEPASVSDAVALSGAQPDGRGLAVAVDGEVVPRGEWEGFELRDGQRIEVLKAVQGG
jgi:sulfur carrier protein